jgi:hypothetical protein
MQDLSLFAGSDLRVGRLDSSNIIHLKVWLEFTVYFS